MQSYMSDTLETNDTAKHIGGDMNFNTFPLWHWMKYNMRRSTRDLIFFPFSAASERVYTVSGRLPSQADLITLSGAGFDYFTVDLSIWRLRLQTGRVDRCSIVASECRQVEIKCMKGSPSSFYCDISLVWTDSMDLYANTPVHLMECVCFLHACAHVHSNGR